ncbi:MAG: pyridoxal phosphate-dependent aminotransferase, partial [Candidatus Heimdallarchaeota archaeon]
MSGNISSINVKHNVDSVIMPENVKIGLMIAEHRKMCNSINCPFDYYAYAFGQSPFHVPAPLEDALKRSAKYGHYSAADGIKELKSSISEFNKRHFDVDVDSSQVFVGHGTKGIIFTIFSIIDADVIIPSPAWVSYVPQLKFLNQKYYVYRVVKENNYRIDPDNLSTYLMSLPVNKQRLLLLNNPNNPTGVVYSRNELEKIVTVCRNNNTLILSDEIYALSTYEIEKFTSVRTLYPEGSFITNGLSKDRSAGGYRLGYAIIPDKCSEKLASAFKKIAATIYTNVSTPTQFAAVEAYKPSKIIEEYFEVTRDIHRIMGTNLSREFDNIDGLHATKPAGGLYFFVDFNDLTPYLQKKGIPTSNDLALGLVKHPYHIATVTGDSCLLQPEDFGARIAFV